MPAPITPERRRAFMRCIEEGMTVKAAASTTGVSYAWARNYLQGIKNPKEDQRGLVALRKQLTKVEALARPLRDAELCDEARQAKVDFSYFRARYFGRVTPPYQQETAVEIQRQLRTADKEFTVMNIAPGVGKTTFLHDFAAWAITNDRSVRGLFGSRVFNNARRQTMRLRRSLERTTLVKPSDKDLDRGLAVLPTGNLVADFGIFRPVLTNDVWRAEEFIVVQDDEQPIDEKEPTWSTAGMDTGFLGNRYQVIFWDDVVDKTTISTLDAIESQQVWWDDEAETRLEPGGVLWLVGQRFSSNDLYRYNLDKRLEFDETTEDTLVDASDDEIAEAAAQQPPAYHHVKYTAHDEANCTGQHSLDAPPQPAGCLLDPRRLPWREIRRLKATKHRTFLIQYQQEDADPQTVLVPPIWVSGGLDPTTGVLHPGCWNDQRHACEMPPGVVGPLFSIATVDPSPTKWWAMQWWIAAPAANRLFLMDTERTRMGGNELLDWNADTLEWYGRMHEWQNRSVDLGLKITHWVVEVNAAQRFLLQYNHVHRWISAKQTHVIPHETTMRKLDPTVGVDMVKSWWEYGRIDLPGADLTAKHVARRLVAEVTRYPNAGTDDQVMAHWFLVHHLPRLARLPAPPAVQPRPAAVQQLATITPFRRRVSA